MGVPPDITDITGTFKGNEIQVLTGVLLIPGTIYREYTLFSSIRRPPKIWYYKGSKVTGSFRRAIRSLQFIGLFQKKKL